MCAIAPVTNFGSFLAHPRTIQAHATIPLPRLPLTELFLFVLLRPSSLPRPLRLPSPFYILSLTLVAALSALVGFISFRSFLPHFIPSSCNIDCDNPSRALLHAFWCALFSLSHISSPFRVSCLVNRWVLRQDVFVGTETSILIATFD